MTKQFQKILLTGDRPTGRLHLGHYVGSVLNRVKMQDTVDRAFYMVADAQALTDNADNPKKVRDNVLEVAMDNIAVGVDPTKTTMFIQSQVPQIAELAMLFLNIVTLQQLTHNPTIKTEAEQKGYSLQSKFDDANENDSKTQGIPMGFLAYPVSQAADILFCMGNVVPVGADQMPVIEQTNDIVTKFNALYGEVFPQVEGVVGDIARLVGTDGNAKASKSLGNAIFLADAPGEIERKVMSMYTDDKHLRVEDPGSVEGNVVFSYLDAFDPDVAEMTKLKEQYQAGGLGDVTIKKRLIEILRNVLDPIRERREELAKDPDAVMGILKQGTEQAREVAEMTMREVRKAMSINYY